MNPRTEIEMRAFMKSVTSIDEKGCWIWQRGKNKDGYGQTWFNGTNIVAHRVAWSLFNNMPLPSLCVLHSCDTPACINPAHLFLGTNQENTQDKMMKGRHRVASGDDHYMRKTKGVRAGVKCSTAKLSESDVVLIAKRLSDGETQLSIAKDFSVSRGCISAIATGRNWKYSPAISSTTGEKK